MGFLGNLFKKGEYPVTECSDATLGVMRWSQDDEAWFGQFNSFQFSLAYEEESQPSKAVIEYAREILGDASWLASSLADAKKAAELNRDKLYVAEVNSLSFDTIHFFIRKDQRRILAHLDGGKDYRLWRIEYHDRHCDGIGFDS